MTSELKVDKITPASGTNTQIGESGDTITIPSGCTITNSGTATNFGASLSGSTNNTVVTVTGANAMQGESSLTWDGSSLGVGIASPETSAHIQSASGECELRLTAGDTSDARLRFGDTTTTAGGYIGYNRSTGNMYIRSANSGSAQVNITSAGAVRIGDTGSSYAYIESNRPGTGTQTHILFVNGSGPVGSIKTFSNSTQFNTSSDYRLKENEVAISDGIERLKQLKPYRFNFKLDKDEEGNVTKTVDGFFAHEVSPVVPEAISGEKDAEEMQGIDQSKLVPLLTSALQEAITKIEILEAKVETLEKA